MGKRKDQEAVFAARIRQLSADLYPLLLARASDPFSDANTNPFRASGHTGDKYVYIRYCPNRDTRTPLGSPDFVRDEVRQLLAQSHTLLGTPADGSSKVPPLQKDEADTRLEHKAVVSSDLPDLSQALSAAVGDHARKDQPAITVADELPRDFEEAIGRVELLRLARRAAANPIGEERAVEQNDQKPTSLEPPHSLTGPIVDGMAQLSNSLWKLPALSVAIALVVVFGDLLAPRSNKGPTVAFAEQPTDLPQAVPSLVTAANSSSADLSLRSGEQVHLPRITRGEDPSRIPVGKLATLFAALYQVVGDRSIAGHSIERLQAPLKVEGVPGCGELLERVLCGPSYGVDPMDLAIREQLRSNIGSIAYQNEKLVLVVADGGAFRHAIADPENPSRHLAGLGIGRVFMAFHPDHIEVTEVAP